MPVILLISYPSFQISFNADINECDSDNGNCSDICVDTIGSFYCECNMPGYEVGDNGFSCVGMSLRTQCGKLSVLLICKATNLLSHNSFYMPKSE